MTNDQYYRLCETWHESDWPFGLSNDEIASLSNVAPRMYEYHLRSTDDGVRIELYEYVGEMEEPDDG